MVAEGGRYEGYVRNNRRWGYGTLVSRSGAIYEGDWANDKPNGHGRYSKPDSQITYEGSWEDGKTHGHGTFTSASWGTYVGEWAHDQKEGQGKVLYTNGASYEGMWKADEAHGWGRYTWPDGSFYEGQFERGVMQGPGKYCGSDQAECYVGSWSSNQKHGYGRMKYADGAVYDGDWVNDRPHGRGTFVNPYGVMFRGEWEHGRYKASQSEWHDARGVRTCVVEGVTQSIVGGDPTVDDDINTRTVIPAPPPGHPDVQKHLPCPRKHLDLPTKEIFEESSNTYESVVYPRNTPDPTRTGYVYHTSFSTEYYPMLRRGKLTEVDGGRLITVDSESRLYRHDEEDISYDQNEYTHYEERIVESEEGGGDTTLGPREAVFTSGTDTDDLVTHRQDEFPQIVGTLPVTTSPSQIQSVSTVQENVFVIPATNLVESTLKQEAGMHYLPRPADQPIVRVPPAWVPSRQMTTTIETTVNSQPINTHTVNTQMVNTHIVNTHPALARPIITQPLTAQPSTAHTVEAHSTNARSVSTHPLNTPRTGQVETDAQMTADIVTAPTTTVTSSVQETTSNPNVITTVEEVTLCRNIPRPVEYNLVTEFVLPRLRSTTRAIPVPVYAPRIIEVPVLVEDLSDEGLRLCKAIQEDVENFYSQAAEGVDGCALETFADGVVQRLQAAETIEGSHARPLTTKNFRDLTPGQPFY
eukprot:Blabericola_migrator_1__2895@NODE_1831_length_3724_cov_135_930271_g1173_i0_p1_GENE_NODE_1831_length_3724_cov_135_930271_g1173_i0NODE_1831_length_3724_cov_135_930271_g1173_i0_p1_ORF_typecomplete_len706_score86_00MORN/PF02493_20/5_9MORN/PF02493_20/0_7MORN/PF02493_20/8_8e05MORN/PF02493_20/0_00011MORN/PF02493_20/0_0014MORN/PF02493_20/1_3e07MORN/PF02493_20/0_0099MORN/PF02493_20/8_7e06MORN/PF02493_20/0_00072MORN/PF02493_20/7_3e02_NODE_1831_length_3724_cov_135_930271_g1173_i0312118